MSKLDLLMELYEVKSMVVCIVWLSYKSQAEQDTVIAFSIRQVQRAKMLCKQHKAHIANIQQKHRVEKKKRCKF